MIRREIIANVKLSRNRKIIDNTINTEFFQLSLCQCSFRLGYGKLSYLTLHSEEVGTKCNNDCSSCVIWFCPLKDKI